MSHHAVACELYHVRLNRMLPPGWHLQSGPPVANPEPAEASRARPRGNSGRDPRLCSTTIPSRPTSPSSLRSLSSSLDDDRNLMARVYGGGGIAIYWIVNLAEGQVKYTLTQVVHQASALPAIARFTDLAGDPPHDHSDR